MRERLLTSLGRLTVSRPWAVIGVALALTVVAGALLPRLKVLTSREALYPTDVEVNQRFQAFLEDVGTPTNLLVVLEGDPKTLGPFADELGAALRAETDVIRDVFVKADVSFFRDRGFLYLSLDQIRKLHAAVTGHQEDIARFQRLDGLLPLIDQIEQATDPETHVRDKIDLASAKQALGAARELFAELERWLDEPARTECTLLERLFVSELSGYEEQDREGYLRSRDGRMLVLFVQQVDPSGEFEAVHPLNERVRAVAARVADAWRAEGRPPPALGLAGIPANQDEEIQAIRHDVVVTAGLAALAVLLIVVIGFRGLRRALVTFAPLALASVWNLGLTALTYGHLTLITSAFTAILFGLGIDYAVFVTSRVDEERRAGLPLADAIVRGVVGAGRTLLTAGGTTALAFLVIGMGEFKGFAELGMVAAAGVAFVIVAALLVLPALMALVPLPLRAEGRVAGRLVPRRPPPIYTAFVVGAALLTAGASVRFGMEMPFDGDVMALLPKGSESARLQRELAARSDVTPEFVAVRAPDVPAARRLQASLEALPTVARVESVTRLVPADQQEKVRLIREIAPVFDKIVVPLDALQPYDAATLAERLEGALEAAEDAQEMAFSAGQKELVASLEGILSRLGTLTTRLEEDPAALGRVRALEREIFRQLAEAVAVVRGWGSVEPIGAEDLPPSVLSRFRGASGQYVLYVFPRGSVYDVPFLDRFMADVYRVAPEATGFPSTHQVFTRMIMEGFWTSTLYATLVVLLMMAIDFRRPGYVLLAALPLLLGGAWMFGMMVFLRIGYNHANLVALPLIIGLGVDYGVFLVHRLREAGGQAPFAVVAQGSRPVLLAATTTLAGIGALVLGQHQGIASLGQVLILGISACLTAAVVVLPAAAALGLWLGGAREADDGGDAGSGGADPTNGRTQP